MGGALARLPRILDAVAGREGAYTLLTLGVLTPGHERLVNELGESVPHAMAPWSTDTSLMNWLGATATPDEVARAWQPEVHGRPMTAKREVVAAKPAYQVVEAEARPREESARRVREHEEAPGMVRRGRYQPLVVRVAVAAPHPVQDDDIGRSTSCGAVAMSRKRRLTRSPDRIVRGAGRLFFVAGRNLQVVASRAPHRNSSPIPPPISRTVASSMPADQPSQLRG